MQISIVSAAEIGGALALIISFVALVYKFFKWVQRQEQQDKELVKIFDELETLSSCILACLDGLKQQGCNGRVTEAYQMLEQKLNENAHSTDRGDKHD